MPKQNKTKAKIGNHQISLETQKPDEIAQRIAATPFALMKRFNDEMEHLFGDFGAGRGLLAPLTGRGNLLPGIWAPQVEIFERDDELVVRADLPGLTKDDVKVEVADDGITIEGERKQETEDQREGYYRSERSYGKFYRTLPLPDGVDSEEATATFRNGVLEVTMPAPKRAERKSRRLEIGGDSQKQHSRKAAA